MSGLKRAALTLALALVAAPMLAYVVYLRDGSKIVARDPYRIEGEQAIIVLQNGTRTSIEATEIDVERTRRANSSNLGSALELEDGQVTEYTPEAEAPEETLSDLLTRRPNTSRTRPPAQRQRVTPSSPGGSVRTLAGNIDYQSVVRRAYGDLDVAGEIQRLFRAQGIEEVLLYQGTEEDHLLTEFVANSEAAAFRILRVAAGALLHIRENFPGTVNWLEVVLSTSGREPAGQFLLGPESAALLTDEEIEVSQFFVDHVRF